MMHSHTGWGLSRSRHSRRVPSFVSRKALLLVLQHGAVHPSGARLELVIYLPPRLFSTEVTGCSSLGSYAVSVLGTCPL